MFKLGNENVYVLPPILKRKGLFFSLAFPVAKRFDKNTISRPVGVILVNKHAREKCFDMSSYEFTNYSQDFEKKYNYKTFQQEYLKTTLNLLLSCYPKFSLLKTKDYSKTYIPRLKNSFDEDYFNFYDDLASKKLKIVSNNILTQRQNAQINKGQISLKELKTKGKIRNEVDFELKNYIRKEVWSTLKDKNAFSKLAFLDLLGATLKMDFNFISKDDLLKQKKFQMAKDYAKAVNLLEKEDSNIDFLSKLLIIFLNSMLIEEKKQKVIKFYETQIIDSCALLDVELPKIEDKKTKKVLTSYYKQLVIDYSTVDKNEFSNIFSAYLFLFLN